MKNISITGALVAGLFLLSSQGLAQQHGGGGPGGGNPDGLFAFVSSCTPCHHDTETLQAEPFSFVTPWKASMMRFSFVDPLWYAKVFSETRRLPKLASAIEKKCTRCHAPMAHEQATQDNATVALFGSGFSNPANPYHPLALEGIGCTLCHQIVPPPDGSGDVNSGAFTLATDRVARAPFKPMAGWHMEKRSGFLPERAFDPQTSEFCATCHDLYTDYADKHGDIVSTPDTRFPEQTPYREWLESQSAQDGTQCQDCHMVRHEGVRLTSSPPSAPFRDRVMAHTFYTENLMMLDIIDSMVTEVEVPDFSDIIRESQAYLRTAGTITIDKAEFTDKGLRVEVLVTNDTGHKLPTSIPIRRVFIHLAVYDRDDNRIFSSGDTDNEGRIIGVDADEDLSTYEPHHDVITSGSQVQVYEGVMENVEGEVTYTLLRASRFAKDNRVLPRGFDKSTAPQEIRPAGKAMDDGNFKGGSDRITYVIAPVQDTWYRIEAELKDQTVSFPFVEDLASGKGGQESPITRFVDEYDHHRVHYELIATDELIAEKVATDEEIASTP